MSAKVVKRENITAVIREYEKDGETKKVRRTIGERTVFQADDGSYFTKGELYHMPGVQIDFYEQTEQRPAAPSHTTAPQESTEIRPEQVPL